MKKDKNKMMASPILILGFTVVTLIQVVDRFIIVIPDSIAIPILLVAIFMLVIGGIKEIKKR